MGDYYKQPVNPIGLDPGNHVGCYSGWMPIVATQKKEKNTSPFEKPGAIKKQRLNHHKSFLFEKKISEFKSHVTCVFLLIVFYTCDIFFPVYLILTTKKKPKPSPGRNSLTS